MCDDKYGTGVSTDLNRHGLEDVDSGCGSDGKSSVAVERHRGIGPNRKYEPDRGHVRLAVDPHDDTLDRVLEQRQ